MFIDTMNLTRGFAISCPVARGTRHVDIRQKLDVQTNHACAVTDGATKFTGVNVNFSQTGTLGAQN